LRFGKRRDVCEALGPAAFENGVDLGVTSRSNSPSLRIAPPSLYITDIFWLFFDTDEHP
jgi:hypothetical protein